MNKRINAYPWATPTEEQKKMFNSLSDDEQLAMLREAIAEGEKSGIAENFSMDELIKRLDQEKK